MAKSDLTLKIENALYDRNGRSVFGCHEVTIGWYGKERVDFMSYDTSGVIRCYEIKISKSDFNSSAIKSFVGNLNYYVLTKELYELVKDKIEKHVGVFVYDETFNKLTNIKKAKKQNVENKEILMASLIRSMYRDHSYNNNISKLKKIVTEKQKHLNFYKDMYNQLKIENANLKK